MKKKDIRCRQIDEKQTMQVRIGIGIHRLTKVESARSGRTIRELVDASLVEFLGEIKE